VKNISWKNKPKDGMKDGKARRWEGKQGGHATWVQSHPR